VPGQKNIVLSQAFDLELTTNWYWRISYSCEEERDRLKPDMRQIDLFLRKASRYEITPAFYHPHFK